MMDTNEEKQKIKDFKRGKVPNPERPCSAKNSSNKDYLLQARYIGGHTPDTICFWNHTEWRTIDKYKKESDAKKSYDLHLTTDRYFRKVGSWEYRIIHKKDYELEKRQLDA